MRSLTVIEKYFEETTISGNPSLFTSPIESPNQSPASLLFVELTSSTLLITLKPSISMIPTPPVPPIIKSRSPSLSKSTAWTFLGVPILKSVLMVEINLDSSAGFWNSPITFSENST